MELPGFRCNVGVSTSASASPAAPVDDKDSSIKPRHTAGVNTSTSENPADNAENIDPPGSRNDVEASTPVSANPSASTVEDNAVKKASKSSADKATHTRPFLPLIALIHDPSVQRASATIWADDFDEEANAPVDVPRSPPNNPQNSAPARAPDIAAQNRGETDEHLEQPVEGNEEINEPNNSEDASDVEAEVEDEGDEEEEEVKEKNEVEEEEEEEEEEEKDEEPVEGSSQHTDESDAPENACIISLYLHASHKMSEEK